MKTQLEEFAPDPFCSPPSIVPCHLLNQSHGLSGDLGSSRSCSGLVFPQEREALAMPPQERLWLDNEQRLLPCVDHPGQKHQEQPIRFRICWPFHLAPEDNKLLTQKGVFCHELGLATGLVGQRPKPGARWCPVWSR